MYLRASDCTWFLFWWPLLEHRLWYQYSLFCDTVCYPGTIQSLPSLEPESLGNPSPPAALPPDPRSGALLSLQRCNSNINTAVMRHTQVHRPSSALTCHQHLYLPQHSYPTIHHEPGRHHVISLLCNSEIKPVLSNNLVAQKQSPAVTVFPGRYMFSMYFYFLHVISKGVGFIIIKIIWSETNSHLATSLLHSCVTHWAYQSFVQHRMILSTCMRQIWFLFQCPESIYRRYVSYDTGQQELDWKLMN